MLRRRLWKIGDQWRHYHEVAVANGNGREDTVVESAARRSAGRPPVELEGKLKTSAMNFSDDGRTGERRVQGLA